MRMWIEMSRDEEHGGEEWGVYKMYLGSNI